MGDIWDHFDEWDRQQAARPWYQKVWDWCFYRCSNLWAWYLRPGAVWNNLESFYQKRTRGFSDGELSELDYLILQFILPRLKRYQEMDRWGWPGPEQIFDISSGEWWELTEAERDDLNGRSLEEWDRMLGKMVRAIELIVDDDLVFIKQNPDWKEGESKRNKYIEDLEKKAEFEEGWKLFHEWFFALWD